MVDHGTITFAEHRFRGRGTLAVAGRDAVTGDGRVTDRQVLVLFPRTDHNQGEDP